MICTTRDYSHAHAGSAVPAHRARAVADLRRRGPVSTSRRRSPLPARGPEAVLSVPLASRQREIELESDELYRGVLVGSVVVVLFAAGLGAWFASRVSDPVSRLTRATRLIAAGRLDVRIAADTADELRRLVDDFNTMTATLVAQRAELARANQLKAWNEMARQVAHEIKNPLTPIQLAAEHLQRVHIDQGRPLGSVFDQCVDTVLEPGPAAPPDCVGLRQLCRRAETEARARRDRPRDRGRGRPVPTRASESLRRANGRRRRACRRRPAIARCCNVR